MAVVLKSNNREVTISSNNKDLYHKFKKWLFNYNHYTKFSDKNCYFFKDDFWISGAITKANRLGLSVEVQ